MLARPPMSPGSWSCSMYLPDDAMKNFQEILLHTDDLVWEAKSLAGLSHKMLWRNSETEASIALVRFEQGAGIPTPHVHASNQFMYCLSGRYVYTSTGTTLNPG